MPAKGHTLVGADAGKKINTVTAPDWNMVLGLRRLFMKRKKRVVSMIMPITMRYM